MRKLALLAILTLFATVAAAQPTLTVGTNPSAYTEDSAATQIDAAYSFTDASDPVTYDTGNLTVSISANNTSFDRLAVGAIGAITLVDAGANWLVTHSTGPAVVGSYPKTGPGSGIGTDALVISFGTTASSTQMQDLLRAITYRNLSNNPVAQVTVLYSITDAFSNNDTDSLNIDITPLNDAPSVTTNTGLTVDEGDTGSVVTQAMLEATDPDNTAGQITYTLTTAPSNGTLRLSGTPVAVSGTFTQADINANNLTYDHDGSETTSDSFVFDVADPAPSGPTGVAFNITVNPVNDAPSVTTNTGLTVDEGDTGSVVTQAMLEATDPDNTAGQITYTLTTAPSNGTLRLSGTPVAVSGTFTQADINANNLTYDHDGSETASDSFVFDVADPAPSGPTSVAFNITVNPVNDAPTLTSVSTLGPVNEDTQIIITYAQLAAAADEADVDSATINFRVEALSTGTLTYNGGAVTYGTTVVASGDQLEWTPALNDNGAAVNAFTVVAYDGALPSSTPVQVTVQVTPTNDPPVAAGVPATLPYTENDPATLVAPAATVTDIDSADFDTGTFIASFISGGTADDQLTIRNSGSITTAPGAPGFIDVLDGATVFGFFADAGAGSGINGQALQVILNANATPARVQALLNRIEYENISDNPTAIHNIQFTVADGDGGVDSASICSVQVTAVNDAPTLAAGTLATATDEDTAIDITFGDLVATTSASDLDGSVVGFRVTAISSGTLLIDVGTTTVFAAVVLPQTFTSADILRWTPASNANGSALAAFSVECFDNGTPAPSQTSAGAVLISVDVNAVNDAPTLSAGTLASATNEDTAIDITFGDLVTTTSASDIDGSVDGFRVTAVSSGTLLIDVGTTSVFAAVVLPQTVTSADTLRWTPAADANGSALAAFSVECFDDGTPLPSETSASPVLVSVDVTAVNDAPSFTPGVNLTPLAPTAGPQTHLAWATAISKGPADESGQVLTFNLTQLPAQSVGTVNFTAAPDIDETTGDLTFTIDPVGSNGIYVYDVTLSDDGGTANGGADTSSPPALLIIAVRQQTVYVDLAFSALNYGDDPNAPSPLAPHRYGIDAFDTVQAGLDHVADGGTVIVAGGTYGSAIITRDVTLDLTAGATLTGNGASALRVNSGTVIVQGGTLDQQTPQTALYLDTNVSIDGLTVTQNAAARAVVIDTGAVVILDNSDINQVGADVTIDILGGSASLSGTTVRESDSGNFECFVFQAGSLDLSGTAANTFIIRTTGGGYFTAFPGTADVDATGNDWYENAFQFDLTLPRVSGSPFAGFEVENRMTHAIDDATRGFVRIESGRVFVTQNSGSIQRGVDEANNNDTLEVDVGTFIELVDVYRPLTMRGAQFGNVGAGRLPLVPANETIVVATGASPASDDLFTVSDDVSIDGFAFEGDRPLFGTGRDARSGVNNDTIDVVGLLVTNCVFENFAECGVAVANSFGATVGTLSNSLFANCDLSAVRCEDDAFLDITGNRILTFPGAIGIQVANFSNDRLAPTNISNNSIDVNANSVAIEIVALDLTSISPIVVSNNTIAATGSGGVGITLQGIYNDMDVQLTGNVLSANGGTFDRGMYFWDIETSNLNVSGGSVDGANVGILLESSDLLQGPASNDSIIDLINVSIGSAGPTSCTTALLVRCADIGGGAPTNLVHANVSNGSYAGATRALRAETDASGPAALLHVSGGTTVDSSAGDAAESIGPTSTLTLTACTLSAAGNGLRINDGIGSIQTSDVTAGADCVRLELGGDLTLCRNNNFDAGSACVRLLAGANSISIVWDNSFTSSGNGLVNQSALTVNAEENWWGSTTGPSHSSNPGGVGEAVVDAGFGAVDFSPWWASGVNTLGSAPPGFAGGDTGLSPSGQARHAIPTELRWVQQPGNGTAGIALVQEPIVRATDANGILGYNWDGANGDAFLVFSNNPTGASLQGNPVIQAVDGFADFTNVAVSTGGVGFTVFVIGNHGPFSLANSPISLPFNIDNLLPTLSSISPTFVNEGAGSTMLQVDGTNFNGTTVVRVNGADRPTFFVNVTRILAALTPTDTGTPAIHTISVFNPSPGGGTAAVTLPFTVNGIPSDISLAPASVLENQPAGTPVGSLGTTDAGPAPESHVYSLVFGLGSTDNSSFQVSGSTIQTAATFDRELKSSYSIRVRSTDSRGAWTEKSFTITILDVNEAPTAVADSYNVNEDGTLVVNAATGVLANDSDPENNPLTATLIGGTPANTSSFTLNPNGSFNLTPSPDYFGPITFQYQVADNAPLAGNTVTVTITVNPVNDQPAVTGGSNPTVNEDAGPQSLPAFVGINPGPANESGQVAVAFSVQNLMLAGGLTFTSAPAINAAGTLTFETAPNSNGTATFQVAVQDNGGTANGGVDVSSLSGLFTITVNAVNDAPSFTVSASSSIITVAEDSGPHSFTNWASFSPGPANESAQSVSAYNISSVSNSALFASGPAVSAAGTLSFTLNAHANGSSTFDVSVTDSGGGSDTSPNQTFTIIVTPVNDAPTLSTVGTLPGAMEDTPFSISFATLAAAANEADVDGDPVHFRIDSLIAGSLTMNGNPVIPGTTVFSTGSLLWTPPANQNGTLDAFTVLAWDGLLSSSSPVTVQVIVAPANDAPVVVSNTGATLAEGGSTVLGTSQLEVSDLEDGAAALVFELTAISTNITVLNGVTPLVVGGTFTQADLNGGAISINHNGVNPAAESFNFFVVDSVGAPSGRLPVAGDIAFNVTVTPVNDAPTLAAGLLATAAFEDTPLDITFGDLQATTGATDSDGTVVGFRVTSLLTGTLFIDQTGTGLVFVAYVNQVIDGSDILRWQAPLNANGSNIGAFNVEAIDNGTPGSATSASVLVSIDVTSVNDQPTATGSNIVVGEDSGAFGPVAWAGMLPGGGADESTQTATNFSIVGISNPGLFSAGPTLNAGTGQLSFTPAPNAFGVCTIQFTVQDTGGTANGGVNTSAPAAFTITVNGVNDAPTLSFVTTLFGGPEDSPINVSFGVLQAAADEADIDSSPVNFRIEGVTAGSTLTLNGLPVVPGTSVFTAADTLVWTPGANLFGTLNAFTVRAWDGALASSTPVQVRLFIENVNDQPGFSATNPAASLEDAGAVTVIGWATFNAGPNEQTIQAVLNYTVSGVANLSGTLGFLAGPSIDNNGNLHYTAAPNTNGTAEFYATVRDTGGTASGGVDTSVLIGPFVITVTTVNDAPTYTTSGNPAAVNEDSGTATVTGWVTSVDFGPTDEDAPAQAVSSYIVNVLSNPGLFSTAPAVSVGGVLTYTPAADAFGAATIEVMLVDNGGTANGGVNTSAAQVFTITVNPLNDAPSVTGGSSPVVNEDSGPQSITNFVGMNAGPANESGQVALAYSVINLTPAGGLTFTTAPAISAAGTLTFEAAANSNGSATFQVTVQDNGGSGGGNVDTSAPSAVFTITVTPVNDAPTMTFFSVLNGALEDTGFTITYADLQSAGNDADIDSVPVNFRIESVIAGTLTKGGSPVVPGTTTVASGESLVWTAPADQNGTMNAFTLVAWDGALASSPALTAQVAVTAVNDVPSFTKGADVSVAWDQGAQSVPGWATGISVGPANESAQIPTFNIISNSNPALFSVQPAVSAAGTLSFTPAFNVAGTAAISLEVQDNGGVLNGGVDTSAAQSFNITITTAGEINLFRTIGTPIADGTVDSVGSTVAAMTPQSFFYTVENLGNGALTLSSSPDPVLVTGTINCEAYITHQASGNVAAFSSTSFVLWLKPLGAGNFSADLSIASTDADEDPYEVFVEGTAVAAPDLQVSRGFSGVIESYGVDQVGSIRAGVTTTVTYTLENIGSSDLNFGTPIVSVLDETNCVVVALAPGSVLLAGGTDTLQLDVLPSVPGNFSFVIQIDSDDPDEGAFVLRGEGTATSGAQPELELFGRRVLSPADNEDLGLIPSGSNTTFVYEVRNVGASNLSVTNPVAISNVSNAIVLVTTTPGASVSPGQMTPFTIDVTPLTPGAFQFDFELVTNDADESPLVVTVSGMATAALVPEIDISRDGAGITSSGTDDLGDLPLSVYSTFVYRIRNQGTSNLDLNLPVRVISESNCEVRILAMPDGSVAPQDDTTVLIGVRPVSNAAFTAVLRIDSNDADEGQYLINLAGTGPQPDIQVEYPLYTPQAHQSVIQVGNVVIGSAGEFTLHVRNVGTAGLTINTVSPSAATNCTGALVTAGTSPVAVYGQTDVVVSVTPTAGGAFSVTFIIATNDPDTPNFEIVLEGTGVKKKSGGGGGDDDSGCAVDASSRSSGLWLLGLLLVVATGAMRMRGRRQAE